MPRNTAPNIDISLEGVGPQAGGTPRSRASIDIPLGGGGIDPDQISALELEMVNRHHAEVKAAHRRARKGE